jgi:DNA-binding NarL/FixJ family response regulator
MRAEEMCIKYNSRLTNILMLDSEKKLLNVIKNYFSIKNINIMAYNTPEMAWSQLEYCIPDCMLIDTAMPNDEGYKFIQNVKQNKKFQYIPFIFLTTKGLTEDRIQGYTLGCAAYISKPFDPEELEVIMKNIIVRNETFLDYLVENYYLIKQIKMKLIKKHNSLLMNDEKLILTYQEQLILNQLLMGKTVMEIALRLNVSRRNVERYITRLFDKTQMKNSRKLKYFLW